MPTEEQQLETSLAALEAQRHLLGDAVVDAALGAMRARLCALRNTAHETTQSLRQVSILFLDVVGSTTLAQRLDPEEVSVVMDGALSRGTAVVEAHRGRALQYAGDNILAAFGADEAAEDDTERAVRCGLDLLALGRTLGSEVLRAHGYGGFDFRVGIHTGAVLLGGGIDDDASIRGQAVNIAARMEQAAPPGGLRISHDTYVHVRGLFEVSAPEPLRVKGLDEPVVSYLVAKAKPRSFRVARRGIEGVATRMIGREAELEALQAAFRRLLAERRFVGVSVVAEAGIGKSRLLDEFQTWTEDHPETVYLFRGRASPQTRNQPFGLLRDVVGWRLQLGDDDTLEEAKAKIEQGLIPLFADEPAFAEGHAHVLGHLIGLDWKESPHVRGILDDPRQIRNRAQHAAARMFRRMSAQGDPPGGAPVILQLEDLHWADDESLDFLNYLAEVDRDMPLLMLAFTRPTLFERRADWPGTAPWHERIDLRPLDKSSSGLLVDELLQKLPEIPVVLRDLVIGGAEGNPFYMEELVRMLIDQGAIDASGDPWRLNAERLLSTKVPSTLTGVLQARLDGLPADERLTLQEASVIGQVFWDQALHALDPQTEATLPRLVRRELALPRHDAQLDGLREYAFKHALLHHVTYGTVLRRQRKALHAKLAGWLAAQGDSDNARAGDFLGMTADHYAEAGDEANAAEFHARAAEHAAGRLAHAPTLAHVHQALVLLDRAGDNPGQAPLRWRLLQARERTLEMQGEREKQAKDLDAMQAIAETLSDQARQAYTAHRRATRAMRMAQFAECAQFASEAAALAEAALARSTAPTKPDDGLYELRLLSLRQVGLAMTDLGRWDEGQALLQKTLDEARARGLLKPQVTCLNSLAVLADRRGDEQRGLQLHRESLDMLRRIGGQRNEATALVNVGAKLVGFGDLAGARRDLEEGLRLSRQNGDRVMECAALCNLSRLALWQGDDAHALATARSALDTAVAMQARDLEVAASQYLGAAEEALGRLLPAARAYAHSHRVAEEIGARLNFDANAGLASVAAAQGDIGGALDALRPLLSAATPARGSHASDAIARHCEPAVADAGAADCGPSLSPALRLNVYLVLTAAGDPRAAAWLHDAYRSLMAQADAITDVELRKMFLTNIPPHRKVVALWLDQCGP
ncbi:MAG TPA: adenylate/guanylate cyclase domain-containing protein [Candidatus Limnocylindria bacterium]|nr:adenylate/guanylate cyclase domain-containing protein [Candidatus Limnocylindria bacterium]